MLCVHERDARASWGDTEVQFLYHFFENHYHKGNRFVIEIESGLYTCTSCQKYLQAAQKFAKTEDKILEINFIAHPDAIGSEEARIIIKEK